MNRLAGQASAYLAAAAHQPVHWHPWGEEPFRLARATDRPVLLDIGAAWCHWCHVMDGESYEDTALAQFLNDNFVCIKVDRDERPDVDARYQRAVQALTGQGGWPLTAILTPDGEVFYGGTYFPPDGKYGRPGFRAVLERVLEIWSRERGKVAATATELRDHVGRALLESAPGELGPGVVLQGADSMARLFDWRYGGFGTAPKFPHPGAIEFLIGRWWDTGESWPREIAEKTLTAMARGGVYDQVGGGFHRYSVDERWIVPHFEKMAFDNAELLLAYLRGYAAFGTPLFRETAEGIVSWVFEVLADREAGCFGASQDADAEPGDDGDYFTWTPDEAHAVLSREEWEVARRYWDIYPEGEMRHDPSRNVLWVARSVEALARETGRDPAQVRDLVESSRAKLKAARDSRRAPFVDRTPYASWNAMLAGAFLEAGTVLERSDCTEFALRVLELLWDRAFVPGQGMPHRFSVSSVPSIPPVFLLDDQVHAASAFITAFEHTGDGRWLDRGREMVDIMLAFHWDDAGGGLFDTREEGGSGLLALRAKPIQDAPTSSPNGTAALVLLRLAAVSGEAAFARRAEELLRSFAGAAVQLGLHAATWLRAVDWLVNGACTIEVAPGPSGQDLVKEALTVFRPRKVVIPRATSPVPGMDPPVALVCAGRACSTPLREVAALREALETFGRNG